MNHILTVKKEWPLTDIRYAQRRIVWQRAIGAVVIGAAYLSLFAGLAVAVRFGSFSLSFPGIAIVVMFGALFLEAIASSDIDDVNEAWDKYVTVTTPWPTLRDGLLIAPDSQPDHSHYPLAEDAFYRVQLVRFGVANTIARVDLKGQVTLVGGRGKLLDAMLNAVFAQLGEDSVAIQYTQLDFHYDTFGIEMTLKTAPERAYTWVGYYDNQDHSESRRAGARAATIVHY